jgi:hypothetical protein
VKEAFKSIYLIFLEAFKSKYLIVSMYISRTLTFRNSTFFF